MQCACALLSSVTCLQEVFFSRCDLNIHDFRKETCLNTKCVFWFSLLFRSEKVFILRRNERHMIKNVRGSSCKVPVILVRCEWNLDFLNGFSKIIQIPNFVNICPVGAELFHVDGQTDKTKLRVAFRNFANATKNRNILGLSLLVCWFGSRTNKTSLSPVPLYKSFDSAQKNGLSLLGLGNLLTAAYQLLPSLGYGKPQSIFARLEKRHFKLRPLRSDREGDGIAKQIKKVRNNLPYFDVFLTVHHVKIEGLG